MFKSTYNKNFFYNFKKNDFKKATMIQTNAISIPFIE